MHLFNKNKYYFFLALILSIIVNFKYIDLGIENLSKNKFLYPDPTVPFQIYEFQDIDDNFQWVRRANEKQSIFNLSANIYGSDVNLDRHFQSSRGLSYYLAGLNLFFIDQSLNSIIFSKVLFLLINILLFFKIINSFYQNNLIKFSIVCLSIIFANKLFGGVLNPYHYLEYFFNIKEFYGAKGIDRIPNILISNIFVLINYILFKKFIYKKKIISFIFLIIFLITSAFITPIIFITYFICLFLYQLIEFFEKKSLKKYLLFSFLYLLLFSPILYFHYINLVNINDGSLNSPQWTGNYLYDLEIFFGPLILIIFFLNKEYKKYKFELIFFISQIIFFILSFFYDSYLASKINENFIYINSILAYCIIFKVLECYKFEIHKNIIIILILFFNIYILLQHGFSIKFFLINFIILTIFSLTNFLKLTFNKYIFSIIPIIILIYFSIDDFNLSKLKYKKYFNYNKDQTNLVNYLSNRPKQNIISLDWGLLKNLSIHTNHNIYFINITNTNLKKNVLLERFFDTIYLYGFTRNDLENYFLNLDLKKESSIDRDNKTKKILFSNLYHGQNIDLKFEISKIVEDYDEYLSSNKKNSIEFFNYCIVNLKNSKYIKNDSFIAQIKKKKPILVFGIYEVYEC